MEWQALNAWGATVSELYDWEMGAWNSTLNKEKHQSIPIWFKEKLVAWYELHNQVAMHSQDAASKKKK